MLVRDGRVSLMSVNPTIPSGDNWFMQLDALTGGAPGKTIMDISGDFLLDVQDNVDGNADNVVSDTPEDRVVGQYQSFGLASQPVVGILNGGSDAALINHLSAISPTEQIVVGDPTDPGLLGGHFDLDTSHLIYAFNNGPALCDVFGDPIGCSNLPAGGTDGHVHQWDNIWNLTTINFFSLPDGSGKPLFEITSNSIEGVGNNETFILTIANNAKSPGGIMEINGTSIAVGEYRDLLDRYLSGTMLPGDVFPRYKLNKPTPAEGVAGIRQLVSLKMSFDAFAIISGDLIPTDTGCVRGNSPGELGEYRNGALLMQALNAKDPSGFVYDPAIQRYVSPNAIVQSPLGYATDGLLWEATIFWHWDGPCYGDPLWAPLFDSCVTQGLGGCTKATKEEKKKGKKKKKKKKKKKDDDEDDSPPPPSTPTVPPPVETDPGQSVTNTTIGGNNDTGRLFWREVVPEE
jgi:hypothetical protein